MAAVIFQSTEGQGRNSATHCICIRLPAALVVLHPQISSEAVAYIGAFQFVWFFHAGSLCDRALGRQFIKGYGTLIFDKYLLNFEMMNFRILMLIS